MNLTAAIVTYNPQPERFYENLHALLAEPSVERVFIVDNGSDNLPEVLAAAHITGTEESRIQVERLGINTGMANALNHACHCAIEYNSEWLLTMDQDSVIAKGLADCYLKIAEMPDTHAGIISCRIEDRNYGTMFNAPESGLDHIDHCITSGSMLNLKIWSQVGGFDEKLFIDGVDSDYCITLKEEGYDILRCNDTFITHEIGHGEHRKLLGRNPLIMNHPASRLRYISRNYLYIGHKHGQMSHWRNEVRKRALVVLLYEKGKTAKLKAMAKGARDFRRGNMGILDREKTDCQ